MVVVLVLKGRPGRLRLGCDEKSQSFVQCSCFSNRYSFAFGPRFLADCYELESADESQVRIFVSGDLTLGSDTSFWAEMDRDSRRTEVRIG